MLERVLINSLCPLYPNGGRGDRLLVLLAVLARVRGAEFDLAVHAGER